MKSLIVIALIAMSQMSFAAGPKPERELSREKATQILESKDKASKEKYLSKISDMAGKAGGVGGLSENIKKALLQGDADLLITVYKAIDAKNESALKFIAEVSAGVKTTKEANALAKISDMSYTGNFKAELTKEIESGKSLTDAVKAASKSIGKTGKNEITIEKILECIV
jgi:hypothetical protein